MRALVLSGGEGSRLRLSGSLLGRNVEVRDSGSVGVHRVIVGDQSRLEVD
ncbi:MAG: hypothetical protein M3O98_03590 [Actinomycetota bacterium]|nr:hypothetical protein [Actinomycetota bacterium]